MQNAEQEFASTDSTDSVSARASEDGSISVIMDSVYGLWEDFLAHVPQICAGIVILVLTWVIARIATKVASSLLKRTKLRTSLKDLFRQLVHLGFWVLGLVVAAVVVFPNMTPARVFAALGLGSIAIGFAFKDIFENFFAGVLILWRFPFDPGDYIECEGICGRVEDITIRMTKIRRVDGVLAVMPNAILFKQPVDVFTNWQRRRVTIICGVAYGEDVDAAREVIADAVRGCETVDGSQDVEIFAQEFASSSINFEVTWWTQPTPLEVRTSRDEVVSAVKRALDEAEIEIPFPYRTLTFKEPLVTSSAGRESNDGHDAAAHNKPADPSDQ